MLLASPEDHCAGPWGNFNARSVLASLCSTSAKKIHWGSSRRAVPGNSAPGSLANSLYHPVLLAEGAAVVLFHPQGHAAVMEGMIAFSPDHNTILLFVFSLTSKTGIFQHLAMQQKEQGWVRAENRSATVETNGARHQSIKAEDHNSQVRQSLQEAKLQTGCQFCSGTGVGQTQKHFGT